MEKAGRALAHAIAALQNDRTIVVAACLETAWAGSRVRLGVS